MNIFSFEIISSKYEYAYILGMKISAEKCKYNLAYLQIDFPAFSN